MIQSNFSNQKKKLQYFKFKQRFEKINYHYEFLDKRENKGLNIFDQKDSPDLYDKIMTILSNHTTVIHMKSELTELRFRYENFCAKILMLQNGGIYSFA